MRALFIKELKDNRFLFLAVLAMLGAISVAPGQFGKAWAGMSTFLLVPVLCSYIGGRLLQSETEDEQLEMLLTLPISRARIWWAKTGAGLLLTLAITILCTVATAWKDTRALRHHEGWVMIASFFALYALAGFYSLVWQRGQGATFSAIGSFVAGLTSLMVLRDQLVVPRRFAPEQLALFIATGAVIALAASYFVFTRADLLDERDRRRTAFKVGFVGGSAMLACFVLICL